MSALKRPADRPKIKRRDPRRELKRFRRHKVPEKGHWLVRFIFNEMNEQHCTVDDVAFRAGVTVDGIRKWRYQRAPRLGLVEAVIEALGYELYLRPRTGVERDGRR